MRGYTASQRKLLAQFFMNTAIVWYGGIVSGVVVRSDNVWDQVFTITVSVLFTYGSLKYALYLEKGAKK